MSTQQPPLSRAERRKLEMRRDIVDAAFECFAESGYHGTGIADIAARLGIGHGTFYRYFENKRDIIEHVIDDLLDRIRSQLMEQNAPEAPTTLEEYRAQTVRIADGLTEVFTADPRVPRLLLLEATSVDAAMTERVLGFFDTAAELTAAYFRHGVVKGYLRADLDVLRTARAVNGMIMATVLLVMGGADDAEVQAQRAAVWTLMYDGIVARPTEDVTPSG